MSATVQLQNVVICYPHLWQPHAAVVGAQEKYAAEFLFDPEDRNHQAMKEAAMKVLQEEGKVQYASQLAPPWQTGEEINARRAGKAKEPRKEIEGKICVTAKDPNYPPVVVAQDGVTPIGEEQAGNIFGGCIVNAIIDVFWSKNPTNPGLYCGLRGVQLVNNVGIEPIGSTREAVKFAPVEGAPEPKQPGTTPTGDATPSWMGTVAQEPQKTPAPWNDDDIPF